MIWESWLTLSSLVPQSHFQTSSHFLGSPLNSPNLNHLFSEFELVGEPSQPSRHQRRALFSLGTGKVPEFVLLEVVAPLVPDGDDDLVVAGVDLAAQGAPHPQRLGSKL